METRPVMRVVAFMVVLVVAPGCRTTSPEDAVAAGSVRIDQLAANPRVVEPATRVVEFRYRTSEPVSSRLIVLDPLEAPVAELDAAPSADVVEVAWQPSALLNGVYTFRVETLTPDGWRIATKPPSPRREVLAQRFQFDREPPQARFILPEPAFVVLRVGTASVPLLRTLMDWKPLPPGSHQVRWDGLDSSGAIRVGLREDLRLGLRAYSLPDTYLIAQGFERTPDPGSSSSLRPTNLPCMAIAKIASACQEPQFDVRFVGAESSDSLLPRVRDYAIVRVSLGAADRAVLLRARFEVMFFVDTVFLFEEEQATDPLNYTLDVSDLPPGEHLLTVNVLGYDDRVAVRSVPFVVAPREAS